MSRTDSGPVIVLDAHGVVFNRAFPDFLLATATARGDDPDELWGRWSDGIRLDFWEGRSTPTQMWDQLFPGESPARLSAELERRYEPGPLYRFAATTPHRLWLLSNHRSGWLLPRLTRFGLADRFERVLVSDQLGVAKPDPRGFADVAALAERVDVTLYDDSRSNVATALDLGIDARLVPRNGRGTA